MTSQAQQDDEQKSAQHNEALRQKWNGMTAWYASLGARFMAPTYAALMPHLQLETLAATTNSQTPLKVLDVAVGDGLNTVRLLKELMLTKSDAGFEYYGVDIAEQMVEMCRQRIKQDRLIQALSEQKYKIELSAQNGEDLSAFADASFDRYISSLCLMITGDATAMIKESFRVLKTDGISAWAIWGHQEKGVFFESIPKILGPIRKKLDMAAAAPPPAASSNYHLANDMKQTVQRFKDAGFRQVFWWDVNCALPVSSAKDWCDYMLISPSIEALLRQCKNDEQRETFKQMFFDGLNEVFTNLVGKENKAITHNNICIVAIK